MIMKIVQKCRQGRKAQPINGSRKGPKNKTILAAIGVVMLFQTASAGVTFSNESVAKWYKLTSSFGSKLRDGSLIQVQEFIPAGNKKYAKIRVYIPSFGIERYNLILRPDVMNGCYEVTS